MQCYYLSDNSSWLSNSATPEEKNEFRARAVQAKMILSSVLAHVDKVGSLMKANVKYCNVIIITGLYERKH